MTEPITREELFAQIDAIRMSVEDVIRLSPAVLPEFPKLEEISSYAAAMNNLSFALEDLDRAKVHLKGGK